MAFTINAEADKLMNKALDDLNSQLKSAESHFESDGRLLEIRSSYTIRDMTDLADIVSESNRITDELYASYEALVRAANSICKPLADQGVAPETLSRLVKMLEHINAECSTLGSNFSASIDSYSLGGIASTRYSPSTEARMIEANWRMLHDMHPLVAEEKARREEKARIERERREEERRIAREKALEDYPARLAAWKQETSRVEAVRGHLMEEARMQERKRLLDEANQAYQAAQGRAEEKAREGGRLRQQANAQLQTLSFFKFGEKMRANEQIIQGEQMIQQADQMLQQAEEEYQSAKADIAKNLERAMERRRRQIEGENPLPSKPRDPNSTDFFSSSSAEAVTAVQKANMSIKEAIYETLLEIGPATITDVMMACDEAAEISNQRVSALLRQLVSDGRVERYEEKRKAFFRAIEY